VTTRWIRLAPVIAMGAVLMVVSIGWANTPPIAAFEVLAAASGSSASVLFDATASHDSDGTIVTYQWLFGDGTTGSGATREHTYPNVSTYTVTLVVTDDNGTSHLTSRSIDLTQPRAASVAPVREEADNVPAVAANAPIGTYIGARAPEFALPGFTDSIVRLSDFLGKVVLLEFWSSGCSACVSALPYLESLRLEYEDRGLVIVDVVTNFNYRDAQTLLAKGGYTGFVTVRETDTAPKATMAAYGVVRVPHAFLIDRTGVVRFNGHLSFLREETIEAWL